MATILTHGDGHDPTKSITERFCQAVGFEALALLICTPLLAWIMDKPALEMGMVTLAISLMASDLNVIFNGLFDRTKTPERGDQRLDPGAARAHV